ncbi:MAG: TetR/AcrR family transcriptional regulator [Alphaproteobacteria bacterium]|nr:TetR/AcrR family transcriptional regulator [Alphaproteobacteria bacterium]MBU1561943.1 TetR/AcrR family transcriptional regulator [Alphaproteobacteria bacterium]MBU2304454.1 TetR/AcrR family transcriptional regulator [Alphaproteobacteria bacterium]MBU2367675.1 TetR/AcrR family transcriptional regulator [Alphaproteobacteria bacterium]
MTNRRFRPQDWIVAALAALAEGGIGAVRIEKLARRLNTSKGSFYWHFADRPALLTALLDFWETEGTSLVISSVDTVEHPAERLRAVADAALIPSEQGVDVARAEAALRAWAAEEPVVAERIARVDDRRVAYLAQILQLMGYDRTPAQRLGTGIYLALMGLYDARRYAPSLADDSAFHALVDGIVASAPQK